MSFDSFSIHPLCRPAQVRNGNSGRSLQRVVHSEIVDIASALPINFLRCVEIVHNLPKDYANLQQFVPLYWIMAKLFDSLHSLQTIVNVIRLSLH